MAPASGTSGKGGRWASSAAPPGRRSRLWWPRPRGFAVDDARVRGVNITDGRLNATFEVSIWADNRNNKVSVYYDAMEVRVVYDDQAVAFAEVAPFFHPHHNATEIRVTAAAWDIAGGKIVVEVAVRARIRYRIATFKSHHYTLRAYCTPVDLYLSPSTPSSTTNCDVELLNMTLSLSLAEVSG
ncbi:unnamed protein product [Spirodela intermedia]|uniref:Late embryogenesis abundant protein LEA-2 subgroup domain-containing protein n=1 Tax=Spirodela intermedia TaxID=51605 RepID=A0A7I8JAU8_SPIIN|nr:unnamed protein product [Spirodela intermedia]CAA6666572.1 unnamed protein product [Spirodela intermedia]